MFNNQVCFFKAPIDPGYLKLSPSELSETVSQA